PKSKSCPAFYDHTVRYPNAHCIARCFSRVGANEIWPLAFIGPVPNANGNTHPDANAAIENDEERSTKAAETNGAAAIENRWDTHVAVAHAFWENWVSAKSAVHSGAQRN